MHGRKPPSSASINQRAITIRIARDPNDLMLVTAIRAAVYMAEQDCPIEEEFDGNDLVAAHFIGFVGTEPAGCLRVRFFGDFAKVERLAPDLVMRRGMCHVPEGREIFPFLTVRENLIMGAYTRRDAAGVARDVVQAGLEAALGEHLTGRGHQQLAIAGGVLAQRTGGLGGARRRGRYLPQLGGSARRGARGNRTQGQARSQSAVAAARRAQR